MKRFLKHITLAFCLPALLVSCDFLDIDPSDRYSPSVVWNSEGSVDTYVLGFYGFIKESDEINDMKHFNDAYSDIIKSSSWNQYNHFYNYALLQESTFTDAGAGPLDCWNACYNEIKQDNEFLRDAPAYVDRFGEDFINTRIAEIRLVRGYAYFQLMRLYGNKEIEKGGVVLRTKLDGPEENDKPRSTWDESWDVVLKDLTFAAEHLPLSWGGPRRFTKAAAYGLISRAALYAERWDVVIEAAKKCEEAGGKLAANYADLFSVDKGLDNPENLLVVNYVTREMTHQADAFFRPVGDIPFHNNIDIKSAFGPTSELVDSYEMADGTAFSWEEHGSDPYTGREPRFYATILYNGCLWEGRNLETFVGGTDGIRPFHDAGAAGATTTGYYLRKYLIENDHNWEKNGSWHFVPFIRFAEVLLNASEALAEQNWGANGTQALELLNRVRERVALPAAEASSLEEFRTILRHERMVELAGEGHRYWDIRRWRIGDEVIHGKQAHGCRITRTSDEGVEPAEYKYEQIEVDAGRPRIFYDRFYSFSIPIVERSNNKLLGPNNPGW